MKTIRATLTALAVASAVLVAPAPAQAATYRPTSPSLICQRKPTPRPTVTAPAGTTYTAVTPRRDMCPRTPAPRRW